MFVCLVHPFHPLYFTPFASYFHLLYLFIYRNRLESNSEHWNALLLSLRELTEWVIRKDTELSQLRSGPLRGDAASLQKQLVCFFINFFVLCFQVHSKPFFRFDESGLNFYLKSSLSISLIAHTIDRNRFQHRNIPNWFIKFHLTNKTILLSHFQSDFNCKFL